MDTRCLSATVCSDDDVIETSHREFIADQDRRRTQRALLTWKQAPILESSQPLSLSYPPPARYPPYAVSAPANPNRPWNPRTRALPLVCLLLDGGEETEMEVFPSVELTGGSLAPPREPSMPSPKATPRGRATPRAKTKATPKTKTKATPKTKTTPKRKAKTTAIAKIAAETPLMRAGGHTELPEPSQPSYSGASNPDHRPNSTNLPLDPSLLLEPAVPMAPVTPVTFVTPVTPVVPVTTGVSATSIDRDPSLSLAPVTAPVPPSDNAAAAGEPSLTTWAARLELESLLLLKDTQTLSTALAQTNAHLAVLSTTNPTASLKETLAAFRAELREHSASEENALAESLEGHFRDLCHSLKRTAPHPGHIHLLTKRLALVEAKMDRVERSALAITGAVERLHGVRGKRGTEGLPLSPEASFDESQRCTQRQRGRRSLTQTAVLPGPDGHHVQPIPLPRGSFESLRRP